MPDRPRNVGASIRQRLLNLAHARGQPMELLLTRYALERLLHRLSLSPHRERFVLKGAMLLATWFDEPHRATRDVDLLGFGDPAHDALLGTFREVMSIEADDGVTFDLKGLRVESIREEVEYGGSRLRATAKLAGARIPITVDIGCAARHAAASPARVRPNRHRRDGARGFGRTIKHRRPIERLQVEAATWHC
jgi:hypothetical protein